MLARPGGMPPPEVVPDDPGPWSIVAQLRREKSRAARPEKRRAQPPYGLLLSRPPQIGLEIQGLEEFSPVAGVGPVRLVAAAREPAFRLWFEEEQRMLRGVSPFVHRGWSVPDLRTEPERRSGDDPVAELEPPLQSSELTGELRGAILSPGGEVAAVTVRDGSAIALGLIRPDSRALVRWIVGARAAAWTADGGMLAVGGEFGVLLAVPRPPGESPRRGQA
jgi:hypothetical protein